MKLRTRLFAWLCAASVASGAAGFVAFRLSATEHADLPNRALVRKLSRRLSRADEEARKVILAEATDTTGIPFEFVAPPALPRGVEFHPQPTQERFSWRRIVPTGPERQGPILLPGDGFGYVPIIRTREEQPVAPPTAGSPVRPSAPPVPPPPAHPPSDDPFEDAVFVGAVRFPEGEHFALGPFPAFLVFGAVLLGFSQLLSRRIAAPLERIGEAAARFGSGDLKARSGIAPREAGSAETAALARAFDRMAERIAHEVREGRELLGAVSHELRSPLGRAKVAVAIAREQLPREAKLKADQTLETAEKELVRVDAILGDLLASARMGLSDLRREPTPLIPWLRERISDEEMPPFVELDAPENADDATFPLDRALVARAVHNLLENARRHAPTSTTIEVVVSLEDGSATLSVCDRGNGFPEALLPKLFTPFVRGDDARNPTQGSGLGLALVRRIAEAHGGYAKAGNREGGGAVITLHFPKNSEEVLGAGTGEHVAVVEEGPRSGPILGPISSPVSSPRPLSERSPKAGPR